LALLTRAFRWPAQALLHWLRRFRWHCHGAVSGKQIGIFASVWLSVKLGIAVRPKDASWVHVYGVALLCGIGFTMSLFIGGLAFVGPEQSDAVKIGV
jgi:NhaA family Na+:H+ antiporter